MITELFAFPLASFDALAELAKVGPVALVLGIAVWKLWAKNQELIAAELAKNTPEAVAERKKTEAKVHEDIQKRVDEKYAGEVSILREDRDFWKAKFFEIDQTIAPVLKDVAPSLAMVSNSVAQLSEDVTIALSEDDDTLKAAVDEVRKARTAYKKLRPILQKIARDNSNADDA